MKGLRKHWLIHHEGRWYVVRPSTWGRLQYRIALESRWRWLVRLKAFYLGIVLEP